MVENVKNIIVVMEEYYKRLFRVEASSQLALALKAAGFKTGLLEIDLCFERKRTSVVMSYTFLGEFNEEPKFIYDGPRKTLKLREYVRKRCKAGLDYLIIEMSPETIGERIPNNEWRQLNCLGAIVVTTPAMVSLHDIRNELDFCGRTGIKNLGIIENYNLLLCPECIDCATFVPSPGKDSLSKLAKVPLLGVLPIDARVTNYRAKLSFISILPTSTSAAVYKQIVRLLCGMNKIAD